MALQTCSMGLPSGLGNAEFARCMGQKGMSRNRLSRGKTVRTGGDAVIRQAISCDICGTEKKQTNHWFVAYDQGGELRVSGWNSRNRLRPGSKHLCGQTCLHKLVDDFMAKALATRVRPSAEDEFVVQAAGADTSLTSNLMGRSSLPRG